MKLGKLSLLFTLLWSAVLLNPAFADVSGSVFQDLPVNGTSSNVYGIQDANELGVEGIDVIVTGDNAETETISTDVNGNWTTTLGVGAFGSDVKVEFTNIPNYLHSSPVNTGSNTTVQFVSDGDTNVNLGLHEPERYSQTNPDITVSTFRNGDGSLGGDTAATASITSMPYTATGTGGGVNSTYATAGDTGAIYGLAYQKQTGSLFSSAFLKRHVGLAGSLGSIFLTSAGTTTEYVDLTAAPFSIDFGSVSNRDVPADLGDPSHDVDAYSKTHKVGIGDMDISPGGDALFLVNMFDKKLYKLAIGNPAKASLVASDISDFTIPTPACNNGEWRPFGIGYGRGELYVGGVCSGENSGVQTDVEAYIYAFNLVTETFNTTPVLTFPTNYPKGQVNEFHSAGCAGGFQVWSDDYNDVSGYGSNDYENCYSQPSLVDISVDVDGSLLVGLRGRFADQMGRNNYPPDTGDTALKYGQMSGDLLRAFNNNGTFTLESNAVAGSVTGCGAGNNDGPGGGEFYCEDFFANNGSVAHPNTGEGSSLTLFGSNEVVVAQIDPLDYDSQGLGWFSHIDGSKVDAYEINRSSTAGDFGKGGGLGDMEFLSDPAPLEIGNRVWDDLNGDGIQDAGEPAIQGVQIVLTCGGLTATVTSGVNGEWLIKDGDMTAGADIPRNTSCTINAPLTEPNNGKSLTTQVVGTTTGSDPDPTTGNFQITTGYAGQNNHTYDIGYRNAPACTIDPPAVTTQCNNNGTLSDPSDDTFTYTINATGSGIGATYSISSGDTQSGVSYNTNYTSPSSFPISGGNLSLTLTDVDTASCTLTPVTVTAPATCSSGTTSVDIAITKTVNPTSVTSGGTATYTIVATNNGPGDATNVVVTDPLPAGVTYDSDDGAAATTESGGTVTWTISSLAASATETLNIVVTVD